MANDDELPKKAKEILLDVELLGARSVALTRPWREAIERNMALLRPYREAIERTVERNVASLPKPSREAVERHGARQLGVKKETVVDPLWIPDFPALMARMRKPQLDQATICEVVKETLGETRGSVVSAPRKHTRTTLPQQMIRAIIQRCYPPDGRVPDEVSTQTVCEQVDAGWAEECNKRAVKKRKSPSWTTIARYLGRRK